ncbi:class IIb bacteriocin, lactobin A/cerein 7B family [Microbulbifer halophilus]|uniref:Class IIb bacteriocin, lactobin A/cerein 7B family n=1 Tax=Microbulbifer halophilus TaxID=453963 RepID=A0ABW5E7C1_9GAMM|nr:class IIb bacteriocin, lactobin A/cerein 7B family [Microbulbifer halophilus]MCW8126875.1 class IIb bacteriocin, lactobin A/cerein 7B family [Microbulbifer halophilus]
MKELTTQEVEQVNAGVWNYVAGAAAGIGGSYVYDSIGGKAGIDSFMSGFSSAQGAGAGYRSLYQR